MTTQEQHPPRRRRRSRVGLLALVSVFALTLAVGLSVISLLGTTVTAPDWLRDRISQRINMALRDVDVQFGDISIVMEDHWKPRVLLRDVDVREPFGARLVRFSDVEGTVALRPLLRGQVQPSSVFLSGAGITLRRDRDGSFDLALAGSRSFVESAPTLSALIEHIDDLLLREQLGALKRIEANNLRIRYEDLRSGRGWTVDGGRLALTRDDEDVQLRGDVALIGARDYATTLEVNYSSRIGAIESDFGMSFSDMPAEDVASQFPALSWLGVLDAPISGALRASVNSLGELGPLSATLQIGRGVLQPTESTRPIPFNSARSYFTYDPAAQKMRFDELSVDSEWVTARAEGQAFLEGMETGWPTELLGQFKVSEISTNPDDFYPEPITIEAATMDMRLRLDPFALRLGEMSFSDQGSQLVLDGELTAEQKGWNLRLNANMDSLTPHRLLELWPASLKPKTRNWIAENVTRGVMSDLQFAVRAQPENRPDIHLGFVFRDLTARFVKQMPPITGGTGHAVLSRDRFAIFAEAGNITASKGGNIDIAGTSFVVPDTRLKEAPTEVHIRTSSTITAALSLLDEEPLRLLSKAGRETTLADGRAEVAGKLGLVLKRKLTPEDVKFDVTGQLETVRSETLVPGRVLAASKLDLLATNERLQISGSGRIGRVPADVTWVAPLGQEGGGRSRLTGSIEISDRFVDEFEIGLPQGSLSGAGRADIDIEFPRQGAAAFQLETDLAGIGLRLGELGWSHARNARGRLQVSGKLGTPTAIDSLALDASGLKASGKIVLKDNGQLDRALFTSVKLGDWLNAPVELVGRGAGLAPSVRITGGVIDLRNRPADRGEGASGGGSSANSGPMSLALDRLRISDGISLTNFRAELKTDGGFDGPFSGKVNDGAAISGRVFPQDGRSAFEIKSDDAGGVFRSAGLLKQANGGKLELMLRPAREPGSYRGKLGADNVRLVEAPALAALLNAISVVGLLEQLSGEGILFGRVEANFHLSPETLTLLSSSAVGASMGISMDGYYDMVKDRMDMQGVVSPLYLVNAVGAIFTRKGEGLIGFNYGLKGPASSPRVRVNPLSILTPGMFREIFRRPAPKVKQ